MISVANHGVVGRTYEDEDEDLVYEKGNDIVLASSTCKFDIHNQIVASGTACKALVTSLIDSLHLELVGTVHNADKPGDVFSKFYYDGTEKLFLVVIEKDIPSNLTSSWLRLIMKTSPQFMVTFGTISAANFYGQSNHKGTLRKLTSCTSDPHWDSFGASLNDVKSLETGNIVTGAAAAVLTHCEARNIPSLLLVSVSSAAMSVASSQAYEQAWSFLSLLTKDSSLKRPTAKDYTAAIKADPYLHMTENLYC